MRYRSNGDCSVPLVDPRAVGRRRARRRCTTRSSIEANFAHMPGLKVVAPVHAGDVTGSAARGGVADPTRCSSSSTSGPTG